MSQLELTHEAIDEVRERIAKVTAEEDSPEKTDKLALLNKEEDEISLHQTTDSDDNETRLVSQRTLEHCQTELPDPEYYYKRKILIAGELLQILAEWGIEDIEFGQILQSVESSAIANKSDAIGKLFGKSADKLNMLDYHYAILGQN